MKFVLKIVRKIYVVIVIANLLISCKTYKPAVFFSDLAKDTVVQYYTPIASEETIKQNDILDIKVSSLSQEIDERFNVYNSSGSIPLSQTNEGYKVDEKGEIHLRHLGNVKAEGLSRSKLKKKLENELLAYMKDPIVSISFLNKKITFIGDFSNQKVYYFKEDRLSYFDAIADVGGFKEDADLKDIIVMRDSANYKIVKHLNFEKSNLINSEWYYVQPDDIVFVKSDYSKKKIEERKSNLQLTVSLIISFSTLAIIIINNFFK